MKINSNAEWIDCNLPWYRRDYTIPSPKLPDLSEREKAAFGLSLKESTAALPMDANIVFERVERRFYPRQEDLYGSTRESRDKWIEDFLPKDDPARDAVIQIINHRRLCKKVNAWIELQPETKIFRQEYDAYNKKIEDLFKKNCFVGAGLANPGTLVEIEENGKNVQYLIGDINPECGACGDCAAFPNDTIIKRYKVILEKE